MNLIKFALFVLPTLPGILSLRIRDTFKKKQSGAKPPDRICVIRLDEIGDFVLFTPFLRALRRTFPNAEITLIVNPAVFGLAFSCSFVDRVEKFDPRRKGIFWPYLLPFRAFFFGRRHHCDFAINGRFDSDFRYAASWMIAGSNAPVRIGWSVRSGRHPALLDAGKDLLYTSVFRKPPVHELDKAVTLAVHAGCNIDGEEPIPGLDAAADVRSALTLNQDSSRRIRLMLFPGGSYANKKWSLERYVAVLRKLSQDFPLEILLIGGEGEKEDCHLVRQYLPDATDLCGKLSLQELYMTARDCDLYLGSDSGPAHVAAAAGTSTLVLFRSPATLSPEHQHSVQRFLPRGKGRIEYLQPERPTAPCKGSCEKDFPHCILQISEDMVLEKLKEMIEDLVAKKENL